MSRVWTARKTSTFVPESLADGAAAPYPLHRANPDRTDATKKALRLLTGYTLLLLPLHAGICYLSTYSPGVATAAVLVTAAAIFVVALAKWLGLEDVLQKLPLLLFLALVVIGLAFLSSQPLPRGILSGDSIAALFILIAVVSVLGSLYRPMVATYQTVTLKTPFRDLCIAAAALLASLALTLVSHALPRFALGIIACAVSGCYAGLVLTEFAAWARANPEVSLERAIAFEGTAPRRRAIKPRGAVLGSALFGCSFGLLAAVCENLGTPSRDFIRFVLALGGEPERALDVLGAMLWIGLFGMVFGFLKAGSSLGATKPGSPVAAARFACQAILVFLTYPDVKHPLVHRLRMQWLRPPEVRAVLTCVTLTTLATAFLAPTERPLPKAVEVKQSASPPYVAPSYAPPPSALREIPPGDLELARISGQPPELWLGPEYTPARSQTPAVVSSPAPEAKSDEPGAPSLVARVVGLVVGPPLVLALMVFYAGLHVLPAYGRYFEKPDAPAPPG